VLYREKKDITLQPTAAYCVVGLFQRSEEAGIRHILPWQQSEATFMILKVVEQSLALLDTCHVAHTQFTTSMRQHRTCHCSLTLYQPMLQ